MPWGSAGSFLTGSLCESVLCLNRGHTAPALGTVLPSADRTEPADHVKSKVLGPRQKQAEVMEVVPEWVLRGTAVGEGVDHKGI